MRPRPTGGAGAGGRRRNSLQDSETDYRSRIYAQYVTRGDGPSQSFDPHTARRWGRSYHHYLRGWLPANRDAAILDIACGSGGLLFFFHEQGFHNLSGVDVSPEQVRIARDIAPNVVEGDLFEFLQSHPDSFDLITALDVVEHQKKDDVLRLLDLCHAALRPGGRLVLQTPNAESPFGFSVRSADFTHEVCFTSYSLGWLLKLCGFGEVAARETGPPPFRWLSLGRYLLWRVIRGFIKLWNIVETGAAGSGVYTRVFLISGVKN